MSSVARFRNSRGMSFEVALDGGGVERGVAKIIAAD